MVFRWRKFSRTSVRHLGWCSVVVLGPDRSGDLTDWVRRASIRPLA
jgi:hypothetical protein